MCININMKDKQTDRQTQKVLKTPAKERAEFLGLEWGPVGCFQVNPEVVEEELLPPENLGHLSLPPSRAAPRLPARVLPRATLYERTRSWRRSSSSVPGSSSRLRPLQGQPPSCQGQLCPSVRTRSAQPRGEEGLAHPGRSSRPRGSARRPRSLRKERVSLSPPSASGRAVGGSSPGSC